MVNNYHRNFPIKFGANHFKRFMKELPPKIDTLAIVSINLPELPPNYG